MSRASPFNPAKSPVQPPDAVKSAPPILRKSSFSSTAASPVRMKCALMRPASPSAWPVTRQLDCLRLERQVEIEAGHPDNAQFGRRVEIERRGREMRDQPGAAARLLRLEPQIAREPRPVETQGGPGQHDVVR